MESITKFLDPNIIPDVTGDDLDVDATLAAKSDLDADSDTVEVDLSKNAEEKGKLSDVVLPGKNDASDDAPISKLASSEDSSDAQASSSEADNTKESDSGEDVKADITDDKESKSVDSGEDIDKESKSDSTEAVSDSESVDDKESDKDTAPVENDSKDVEKGEAEKESVDVVSVDSDAVDVESDTDNSDNAPVDQDKSDPNVDHGESDLEVDTQNPAPLLKLIAEYEFNNTKVYETPNGVRLVYINKTSDLCYCAFDFKVGSYFENDSNRGVSHLLEHLMFNGCPGMSAKEFAERMDKLGMSINAFTSNEVTSYHFSGLKANFIPAFDLYVQLLNSFTLIQESLDKERGVVLNEIGVSNDDNWNVLYETIWAQSYRQHPISHPILGYEDTVKNMTLDQVKDWYTVCYNSKNLTLYLVGDFAEEDLIYAAGKLVTFRDGSKTGDPVITDSMVVPYYKNVLTYKEGITQTLIDSSLTVKNEGFNYFDLSILSQVLGGTMSSYIWNEFREERSIAYQVGSYVQPMDADHFKVHLYAGLNNADDADLAKGIFKDAFTYAKAISEDEFSKGLNIALASLLHIEETEDGLLTIVRDSTYLKFTPDMYVSAYNNLTYSSYQTFAESLDPDAMVTGILYPKNA